MAQTQEQTNSLEFLYESDAVASFLVIKCAARIIDYQAVMLEHNQIRDVIRSELIRKEGINCFYYNITSKISLSFFLNRRRLRREEFLKLLYRIALAVNDSSSYLLSTSNFIFDPEYIYINPATLEPALVYIPAEIGRDGGKALQDFIPELLLMHIHAEGFEDGKLVQRILSSVKSEVFNLKGLIALLSELLYSSEQNDGDEQSPCAAQSLNASNRSNTARNAMPQGTNTAQGPKIVKNPKKEQGALSHSANTAKGLKTVPGCTSSPFSFSLPGTKSNVKDKKEEKQGKKKNKSKMSPPFFTISAVLLQFIMGGVIYLNRSFLNTIGKNQTATYAAAAMIVLAVDLLLFKKITESRLINLSGNSEEQPDGMQSEAKISGIQKDEGSVDGIPFRIAKPKKEEIKDEIDVNMQKGPDTITPGTNENDFAKNRGSIESNKTVLLRHHDKGTRILRSTGKHIGDSDITIDKDDFIIGRLSGHVDYVLDNNAIGKLHVELIYKNGACFVKDLNSVNGTFINNARIESNKEYELKENDRLQLANSEFILIYG